VCYLGCNRGVADRFLYKNFDGWASSAGNVKASADIGLGPAPEEMACAAALRPRV